jgi:hypothetical protein
MSKRIKIATFYPTNLFYEKVLIDWKANSSDKRGSYIIKKALDNLKSYPVELGGYTDLRKIKGEQKILSSYSRFLGIGEDIATRLDAACQYFREREGGLTLQKVRALKKGQAIPYLREAAVTKGKKFVPFISRDVFNSPGIQLGTLADAGQSTSSRPPPVIPSSQAPTTSSNVNLNRSFSQPTIPTFEEVSKLYLTSKSLV